MERKAAQWNGQINHLADPDGNSFRVMKDHVNGLSSLVKEIDKPTIMLGIGIQAKFSDIKDTKHIALHEHQKHTSWMKSQREIL